jgi:hypothetical protein
MIYELKFIIEIFHAVVPAIETTKIVYIEGPILVFVV